MSAATYDVLVRITSGRDDAERLAESLIAEDWVHHVVVSPVRPKWCGNCSRSFRTKFGAWLHQHGDALP